MKKRILLLGTGGTISATGNKGLTTDYTIGALKIEEIVKAVPGIENLADLVMENILNQASIDIKMSNWLAIAKRISQAKDSDFEGIVLTYGTDTLDEFAYFLTLTSLTDKPVIVTGAMRPHTATSSDGPLNLYQAVATATSLDSIGKGALVVFQDTIYSGRDCHKVSTFKTDAFKSGEFGCLGYIRDDKTYYINQSVKRHTVNSEFDLSTLEELPIVPVVYYTQDADPAIIQYTASNSEGFVIAGAGGSAFSRPWRKALRQVTDQGTPVVRSSRSPSGITIFDKTMDQESGTIPAYTLSPLKARVLLMLALTKTKNKHELDRIFQEY